MNTQMIWKKFNETILRGKEKFYCNLSMEDITEADYKHRKKNYKDFEKENLTEPDALENIRRMYINIYELDPAKFLLARLE